jgi:hypothetical protein
MQQPQPFNIIKSDLILVGPGDNQGSYIVPLEPEPLVSHLIQFLEQQLPEVEGLGERPWLIDFLTSQEVKFAEIIPKIKR